MKAFKQINYAFENRIVFGYAGLMSLLSFLIMLSPVFAQELNHQENNQPGVHYDVKKEYDKDGNLTRYDSTYSWYWSDKQLGMMGSDSLLKHIQEQMDLFSGNWNWPGFESFHGIPHMDRFNYWSIPDSSGIALEDSTYYNPWFGDSWSAIAPSPFHNFFPNDSLDGTYFPYDDLSKLFDHRFGFEDFMNKDESLKKIMEEQDEFFERFREYQQEHQKLIEKYFSQPDQKRGLTPQNELQRFKQTDNPTDPAKSGTI